MIPTKIGIFTRLINKPTTMKHGYYYHAIFDLPFSKENKREVRVWLPSDYEFDNPNKRYKAIYMSDGQNLVDRYLSAFGEWEYDKTMQSLMDQGYEGVIAVGIDCPKDPLERTKELCPPYTPKKAIFRHEGHFEPYANKYVDYIVDNIYAKRHGNGSFIYLLKEKFDVTTKVYQEHKNRQLDKKEVVCSFKGTINHVQDAILELTHKIKNDIRSTYDGKESYQLKILINKVFVTKLIGAGGCMIQEIANFAKGASIKIMSNKNDEKKKKFS